MDHWGLQIPRHLEKLKDCHLRVKPPISVHFHEHFMHWKFDHFKLLWDSIKINKNNDGNPYVMTGKVSKRDDWAGKQATEECVWPDPIYVTPLKANPPWVYGRRESLEAKTLEYLSQGGEVLFSFVFIFTLVCIAKSFPFYHRIDIVLIIRRKAIIILRKKEEIGKTFLAI